MMRGELIPRRVRQALVEAVGGWGLYSRAQIAELFLNEGFERTEDEAADPTTSGVRRLEADAFHRKIDFTSVEQVERYLRVIEHVLDDHAGEGEFERSRRDPLLRTLRRSGIDLDERGRLHLIVGPVAFAGADIPSASDIQLHIDRLARLDQEPEEIIGAAKELVEATVKYVLFETDGAVPEDVDVPALTKLALSRLKLHPTAVAPTSGGATVIIRVLGGLAQIGPGLAELRNLGYGTGHGRGARIKGLKRRHADLAARSAIAFSAFVLATLQDEEAPWHDKRTS